MNRFINVRLRQTQSELDFDVSETCLAEVKQEPLHLSNDNHNQCSLEST